MAENTNIEWATHTFNPWEGCQKVGPGCDHCYAETRNARFGPKGTPGAPNWGPGAPRRRTSASNWSKPLKWQAEAKASGTRPRVFCASLADVFDNAVDSSWRNDLCELIYATPDLDWLLLTKRIGNVQDMLMSSFYGDWPTNFRIGATIVNQDEWDRDAAKIAQVAVLIGKNNIFLSVEPMLGPIDFTKGRYRFPGIVGWVICGGESGPGARPMHPDWPLDVAIQCSNAGVSYLFKQWGEYAPYGATIAPISAECPKPVYVELVHKFPDARPRLLTNVARMERIGKKKAGRYLDGRLHDGYPA